MAITSKINTVYYEGDSVKLSFRVHNASSSVVRNATLVFASFPAGLTYVANFKDVGTYTLLTRTWTIPVLQPDEVQTIYMEFEVVNFNQEWEVTATSTLVYNADYPGESETAFSNTVVKHPLGNTFEGFAIRELVSTQTTGSGSYSIAESGTLYVFGTASAATDWTLPALASVDAGFTGKLKVLDSNAQTVRLVAFAGDNIEGNATETLISGDYIEVVAVKGGVISTWAVKTKVNYT